MAPSSIRAHLALAVALALSASPAAGFFLSGEAAVLVPPAAAATSPALQLALRDVQRDLYKVTGIAVTTLAAGAVPARGSLPAGTAVIYLLTQADAAPPALDTATCFAGYETHCVLAAADGGNGLPAIYASGSGVRGAIFGWYSFSETLLGVSPLAHFSGELAAFQQQPIAVNDSLALTFAPPKFTIRTWFVNDEDLLAGHRADPAGRAVFDLDMWDEVCETLLRLKGNAIIPGTNPLPDDASVELVLRRGLALQHHHYDLLGLCVFSFPLQASDWDWKTDPGTSMSPKQIAPNPPANSP